MRSITALLPTASVPSESEYEREALAVVRSRPLAPREHAFSQMRRGCDARPRYRRLD